MARFKAKVRFYIEGIIEVNAENRDEVRKHIEDNLGLCIGGHIHTSTNDIVDWEFPIHFEKVIKNITKA